MLIGQTIEHKKNIQIKAGIEIAIYEMLRANQWKIYICKFYLVQLSLNHIAKTYKQNL